MQVANALNNIIRILFNPKIEAFKLFDFLVVKSGESRYLAQIIEIYDDKFDASQDVAKLKLFYKIAHNNEVIPYDNFTPSKECEIIKIKQEDVEAFLNDDKKTFVFGTNVKSSTAFNLQYEFFDKNALILADKIENSCVITNNLAKNLSKEKHVVVVDSTGIMDFENAKAIKAGENFKLPLNDTTIDYIFDKCLKDATLEFQTIVGDIINEIKKFAKKQENNFIPFTTFLKVLLEQYKVTPYQELKLLITRLKKYQLDEIFAKNKKEAELLVKTVDKNAITVIDLSSIDVSWQKAFLEYTVKDITQDIYLILRLNDENCDVNLINTIYNKKVNIRLVPNVSYNYKKLPSIIQHCKNYILLPSLYQRSDFLDANFALSNLIPDGCIIFGENTDNFLYYVNDYSVAAQVKRKNYRKIALSMVARDEEEQSLEAQAQQEAEQVQSADSQTLMEELTKFEQQRSESFNDDSSEAEVEPAQEETEAEVTETEAEVEKAPIETNSNTIELDEKIKEELRKEADKEAALGKAADDEEDDEEEDKTEDKTEVAEAEVKEENLDIEQEEDIELEIAEEAKEEAQEEEKEDEEPAQEEESVELSDEELDFFEDEENKEEDKEEPEIQIQAENEENKEEKTEEKDDIDLKDIAQASIDSSFEQIINQKGESQTNSISLEGDIIIDPDIEGNGENKENLPIFKEELPKNNILTYTIGNVISHGTYGLGKVIRLVQYEDRQLLQIQFEGIGKKLLDPKVADIKIVQ